MFPLSPPIDNDIHVWSTELDLPDHILQKLAQTLCEDEKAKADRFYFAQHRWRFIAARGILRVIVGEYLHIDPQDVKFKYSPKGKPSLEEPFQESKLQFNLSHSQAIGLYGFSCDQYIGVDIEQIRPIKDLLQLAQRFFAQSEFELLSHLSTSEREKVFFQIWTAKEAYLKANGEGIGGGLETVEVLLNSERIVKLLKINEDPLTNIQWSVIPITTQPDYVATIVVEAQEWNLRQLTLEDLPQI